MNEVKKKRPLMTNKLLFEEESYKIIGTCIEVHKKLGAGFTAGIYEEVLEKALIKNKIPFEKQKKLDIYYEGLKLEKLFVADFVCYDKILLEIKCIAGIPDEARQKAVNALKATQFKLGLLINFGEASLTWKRLINTDPS